jgi:hypothetical protein
MFWRELENIRFVMVGFRGVMENQEVSLRVIRSL